MLDPCLLLSCWQVQYEEGEALAKELGIDYVETSAMNGVGIDTDKGPTAFTRLINRMDALTADPWGRRGRLLPRSRVGYMPLFLARGPLLLHRCPKAGRDSGSEAGGWCIGR